MKKVFLFLLLSIPFLFMTCSKDQKEGCQDSNAINYDATAEKDNGTCQYTRIIFYAPSNQIGGVGTRVTKIEVSRRQGISDRELIGTITEFNGEQPQGCVAPPGAIDYPLTADDFGAAVPFFFTRYFFEDGTEDNGDSYELAPSSSKECHTVQLTLP